MVEEKPKVEQKTPPKVKISVDYRPGRWGKVFHLFDNDGREIALGQNDAIQMAKSILKIAQQK
jgi:hypothetical protein